MRLLLIFILGLVSFQTAAFTPYDPAQSSPAEEEAVWNEMQDENALLHLSKLTPMGYEQTGIASMYWQPQPIACGPGRFNPNAMTAAHKTLPCWSKVKVTSLATGRSVVVTINDRGPYIKGRIIDLSRAAFAKIDNTGKGLTRVKVEKISSGKSKSSNGSAKKKIPRRDDGLNRRHRDV